MSTGYIQANILGRQRGLKFGSLAAENIMSELVALGISTGGSYNNAMLTVIIYWGLFNNAFAKRETLDVDMSQIEDWVDENVQDLETGRVLEEIVRTYEESRASKLVLETLEKTVEEVKKKMTTIKTTTKGSTS
jgi:hypothetical protein